MRKLVKNEEIETDDGGGGRWQGESGDAENRTVIVISNQTIFLP